MKRLNIFIIIILLLNLNCEDSSDVQIIPIDTQTPLVKITNDLYSSDVMRHDVSIDTAWIVVDTIYMRVGYSGGCKEHTFQLYALNYFAESNPPQAEVVLSHNSQNDRCRQFITDTLRFNLSPLRVLYKQMYSRPTGNLLLNIYEPQATTVAVQNVNYHF
ncbi:MAG: hypothetical protein HY960_11085 [Ignavibacteriae bacterium]|nr:hypothetical protein [Ignavibacteriota bacterium]